MKHQNTELKGWRPITGEELRDMSKSEWNNIMTFIWREDEEFDNTIGITDVIIRGDEDFFNVNIEWRNMFGDPRIILRRLDQPIDCINDSNDGEWEYGLYKRIK